VAAGQGVPPSRAGRMRHAVWRIRARCAV